MFGISNELTASNQGKSSSKLEDIIRDYLANHQREEDDFLSNVQKAENAFFARWKELNRLRITNQAANWSSFLSQFQQQQQQQSPPKLPFVSLPQQSATNNNKAAAAAEAANTNVNVDEFKCRMNGCTKTYTTKGNLNRNFLEVLCIQSRDNINIRIK